MIVEPHTRTDASQLSEWWRGCGFDAHPFPQATAESETRLSRLWLAPSNYHHYFSDGALGQSAIIMAPRGVGKSAVKKYLYEGFVETGFPSPRLIVPVSDFGDFLDHSGEVTNATEGALCCKLLAHLAWEFCRIIQHRSSSPRPPQLAKSALSNLCGVIATLGSPDDEEHKNAVCFVMRTYGGWLHKSYFDASQTQAPSLVKRIVASWLEKHGLPKELLTATDKAPQLAKLQQLWAMLAPPLGFNKLLFLVNRLDEPGGQRFKGSNYDVKTTTRITEPLLGLLHDGAAMHNIASGAAAVKVLIWDAAARAMSLRIGKFTCGDIYWTDEQIVELLRRRLEAYSEGRVSKITEIVEPAIADRLVPMLIRYAQRIPRLLNYIVGETFNEYTEHLRHRPDHPTPHRIGKDSFERAVVTVARNWIRNDWTSVPAQDLIETLKNLGGESHHIAALERAFSERDSRANGAEFRKQLKELSKHKICQTHNGVVQVCDELFLLLYGDKSASSLQWELPYRRCSHNDCGWRQSDGLKTNCERCGQPLTACAVHANYFFSWHCPVCEDRRVQ